MFIITPRAHMHSRGKAIGLSVRRLSSVDTKIAISRDLGTWATPKHNESTELGEKVGFKSRDMIHERHK
jgi:hypothetical protein